MTFYRPEQLDRYQRRIEKQREYQRNYRRALARNKIPERPDIAAAMLAAFIDVIARNDDSFIQTPFLAADILERKGFDRTRSLKMLAKMVDCYRKAGEFLPPCQIPERRRHKD